MSILYKYTFRSAWKASSQTPSSSAGDGRCSESQAQDFVLSLSTCDSALQAQLPLLPPPHTHTDTPVYTLSSKYTQRNHCLASLQAENVCMGALFYTPED